MQLKAIFTILNSFIMILALGGIATTSLALEDQATLTGEFKWIVPDHIRDQYPEGSLNHAQHHFIPVIEVSRNGTGVFQIQVTMPSTLAGGQSVTSTYVMTSQTSEQMRFENPSRPGDYLQCYVFEQWVDTICHDVTLKGVSAVPVVERVAFAQELYRGTDNETGSKVVAGAEPGGSIMFLAPEYQDPAQFMGLWSISYGMPSGQMTQGTMRINGYAGTFTANGSSARGLISGIMYSPGMVAFNWEIGGREGYAEVQITDGSFSGYWRQGPDFDEDGTWVGTKVD